MKTIIAYLLIIFGVPLVFSEILRIIFAALLELVIGQSWKKIPDMTFEFIVGICSISIALLIFKLFSINVTLILPIILSFITIVWLSIRKEYSAIIWQLSGIVTAYFTLLYITT